MKLVKARVDQLTLPALDFVIAKAQGMQALPYMSELQVFYNLRAGGNYYYCTKWEDAGPIVEDMVKRGMRLRRDETKHNVTVAEIIRDGKVLWTAYAESTPYAVMIVTALGMHGEYVEVPEELL